MRQVDEGEADALVDDDPGRGGRLVEEGEHDGQFLGDIKTTLITPHLQFYSGCFSFLCISRLLMKMIRDR